MLTEPLPFMDFPLEVRRQIYRKVLTFRDPTTVYTILSRRNRSNTGNPAMSTRPIQRIAYRGHPLFQASKTIARESKTVFCETNTFVLRPKHQFSRELCLRILQPAEYLNSLKHISITLTKFSHSIRFFSHKIYELKGLRTLNIFVSWEKVLGRRDLIGSLWRH